MWTFVDMDDGRLMLDVICIYSSVCFGLGCSHDVISKFHPDDMSSLFDPLCNLGSPHADSYHIRRKDIPCSRKMYSDSTLFSFDDLDTISPGFEMSRTILRWYGRRLG